MSDNISRFEVHQVDKSICTPPNIHVLIGTFIDIRFNWDLKWELKHACLKSLLC